MSIEGSCSFSIFKHMNMEELMHYGVSVRLWWTFMNERNEQLLQEDKLFSTPPSSPLILFLLCFFKDQFVFFIVIIIPSVGSYQELGFKDSRDHPESEIFHLSIWYRLQASRERHRYFIDGITP